MAPSATYFPRQFLSSERPTTHEYIIYLENITTNGGEKQTAAQRPLNGRARARGKKGDELE